MREGDTANEVMEIVIRSKRCSLEEIILECPNLTWNHVFLELDRLSRTGEVRLSMKAPWVYTVQPAESTPTFTEGEFRHGQSDGMA